MTIFNSFGKTSLALQSLTKLVEHRDWADQFAVTQFWPRLQSSEGPTDLLVSSSNIIVKARGGGGGVGTPL